MLCYAVGAATGRVHGLRVFGRPAVAESARRYPEARCKPDTVRSVIMATLPMLALPITAVYGAASSTWCGRHVAAGDCLQIKLGI